MITRSATLQTRWNYKNSVDNLITLQNLGVAAITFDLDDTLWPCAPVIAAAEQAYFDWISENFPPVCARFSLKDIIARRRAIVEEEPELKSDVTELRRRATIRLLKPFGATDDDIEEAVRVCLVQRQKVTFYDEVLSALQELSFHYRLGSITNGNADLQMIGVAHLFDVELAATLQLPAKPAPDMFLRACDVLGVQPERLLHVGDHPVNDVAAARQAGCKTAWISRYEDDYPQDAEPADINIKDLNTLAALAPAMR